MIVDCHTHIWPDRAAIGRAADFSCLCTPNVTQACTNSHIEAMDHADRAIVLGFASKFLQAEISNVLLKNYVQQHPGKLIGFAGLDPLDTEDPIGTLETLHLDGFKGVVLCPACQSCHPCDVQAMLVYEAAEKLNMPVYFLYGQNLPRQACLEYANPTPLDEIGRRFPDLKMIISHLGFPYIEETIAILAKNPNVFADVSGLSNKQWQAYRSLTLAYEYGVIEKLLFGSDFPNFSVKESIEALYNLNKIGLNSVLPAVPRELLRGIVERDSITLLGLD